MIRKTTIAAVALLIFGLGRCCEAQTSALRIVRQPLAVLPAEPGPLQMIDSSLALRMSDVLLDADRIGNQIVGFHVDTTIMQLDIDIEFAQRNPATGDLYLVMRNKKQTPRLYCCNQSAKRPKLKEVELPGFEDKTVPIESPVFTDDGTIMIFASTHPKGYGGYDLWYSELKQGKWQRPQNLGKRINTESDELTPSIYRQYLIFASRGHLKDHSNLNLYITRLLSDQVVGDTVGMLQIGRNRIQRLPEPVNSVYDNYGFVMDTAAEFGYWLTSSNGHAIVNSIQGPLQGVGLWGQVIDRDGNPIDGVEVSAMQDGQQVCSAKTNLFGFYQLYLLNDQNYDIRFYKTNHFAHSEKASTNIHDGEALLSEMQLDAVVDSLPLGQRLTYEDLFDYDASTELSAHGRDVLRPLVSFVADNPHLAVEITIYDDPTTDAAFNRMLAQSRLETIEKHLRKSLPENVRITLKNGSERYFGKPSGTKKSYVVAILSQSGKR